MKILFFLISILLIFIFAAGWVKVVLLVTSLLIFLILLLWALKDPMADTPPYREDIDYITGTEVYRGARIYNDNEDYKLISNKSNIYEIPKAIEFSTYKFPSLDNKEIQEFIDWAKSKKSHNKKQDLFNIFKEYSREAIEFSHPRFEVFPPELTINLDIDGQSDGDFSCEDFQVYGFQINNYQVTSEVYFDCEELSLILSNPDLFDWVEYVNKHDEITESVEYQEATDYGDCSYYLKDDCSEFIPINGEADEYFDFEPMVEYDYPVKVSLTEDISYKGKIFTINDEEFTFLNKDKNHLVTLLNASYLPNIITLISSFSKT